MRIIKLQEFAFHKIFATTQKENRVKALIFKDGEKSEAVRLFFVTAINKLQILFKEYPDIKKGYYMAMRLGSIYHQCKFKDIALTRLARWYDEVDKAGFLTFGRVARSIQTHYLNIINFFERRATNAAAESFNAKIKAFRAQFRGVRDKAFFLYRLAKLYA